MTLLTSAGLCLTLLFVCVVDLASSEQTTITAESGQNVTLTCGAPSDKTIRAVKWSRADLGDEYVLLYRDEQFDPDEQHPSFKNRVDLQDRQMKDGDASLILKDVTTADGGSYKCGVLVGESASWEIVGTVNMSVAPPGHTKDGSKGQMNHLSGSGVFLLLFLFLVVTAAPVCRWIFISRKLKKKIFQGSY
nr:butyrophilin subfamily 1 member A1-like [Maylandia zebra]